jgi:hypothetical protein
MWQHVMDSPQSHFSRKIMRWEKLLPECQSRNAAVDSVMRCMRSTNITGLQAATEYLLHKAQRKFNFRH